MTKTKTLLLLLTLSTSLFAKHDNCTFKNENYTDICKKVVKNGVSYKYANKFLLSYFKTKKFDEISWKYLQPRHLTTHRANEKRANNVLAKYIPKIITHVKKYKKTYDIAEEKYGVNREIIAAILMKETKLGEIKPTHDAFIVFNTMVIRSKAETKREKWLLRMGKANMASIITHCYEKGVKPKKCNLPSSYAGAVGIPQFMPSSFGYIDSHKNEVGDLTNMSDAIMSAAKFLHKKANFTELLDWNKVPNMQEIEEAWYDYDFKHENGSFVYSESKRSGKVYDCFACDKEELQYLKDYVQKIMRYNNSSNYSVGVMRLAYDTHKGLTSK